MIEIWSYRVMESKWHASFEGDLFENLTSSPSGGYDRQAVGKTQLVWTGRELAVGSGRR